MAVVPDRLSFSNLAPISIRLHRRPTLGGQRALVVAQRDQGATALSSTSLPGPMVGLLQLDALGAPPSFCCHVFPSACGAKPRPRRSFTCRNFTLARRRRLRPSIHFSDK